jgi:hypothetical protein
VERLATIPGVPLRLALAAAVTVALASAGHVHAHGGEIIARAIDGLAADPVYVDPTAIPSITPAEADRLRAEIDEAGGRIYVAVLPADAQHELRTARAVVREISDGIGGEATFAAVVGGQFRAESAERPEEVRELEREVVADVGAGQADRLVRFVDGVREARGEGSSGALTAAIVTIAAAAIVLALLGALVAAIRRGSLRAGPGRAA